MRIIGEKRCIEKAAQFILKDILLTTEIFDHRTAVKKSNYFPYKTNLVYSLDSHNI